MVPAWPLVVMLEKADKFAASTVKVMALPPVDVTAATLVAVAMLVRLTDVSAVVMVPAWPLVVMLEKADRFAASTVKVMALLAVEVNAVTWFRVLTPVRSIVVSEPELRMPLAPPDVMVVAAATIPSETVNVWPPVPPVSKETVVTLESVLTLARL